MMLDPMTTLLPFAAPLAQAGQAGEAAQAAAGGGLPGWALFAIFVAIIAVPFLLGWAIAKGLKLPDLSTRLGVVILAATIGATPFVWSIAVGTTQLGMSVAESLRGSLRLGVDLAGGTNLVYEVKETEEKPVTSEVIDEMVGSIIKRINPSGTEEVTVRGVGQNRIEVIVPGADPEKVRRIKRRVTTLGSLEFVLVANSVDHQALIQRAMSQDSADRNIREGTRIVAKWIDIARDAEGNWKPVGAHAIRYVTPAGEVLTEPPEQTEGVAKQILVMIEPADQRIVGEDLTSASEITDENGQPAVSFTLDADGGRRLFRLTNANLPSESGFSRQMAIVLDGEIHSAPNIEGAIGTNGQITGRFTRQEVSELVDILNAGALKAPINPEPVSEYTISPLLGEDTVQKAVWSILFAGVAVLLITAAYYLFAGLIADFCLILNLLLLLGVMSMIDATFTLPGLAGVVLTFGMAVDANVLIFERMREEFERGSSLRMAIQNGFDRALSAIVDSNVTTLITAVILYVIGTDAVKGFAVALFIGIVASMFTALFVARLFFEILDRKRWVRRIKMNAILTHPNINWLKHKGPVICGSLSLLVLGVVVLGVRGTQMLDIDFLGGTMVTFQLDEPTTTGRVRELLTQNPQFEGNVSVERLVLMGEERGQTGRRFRVRTTLQDAGNSTKDQAAAAESPASGPAASNGGASSEGASGGEADVSKLVAVELEKGGLDIRRVQIDVGEVGPIAEGNDDEVFADGSSAEITLQESVDGIQQEFGTETVEALLIDQLQETTPEGEEKYAEIGDLIRVVGLAGSGEEAAETEAKTFSHLRIDLAPSIPRGEFEAALGAMQEHLASAPVFDEVNTFDSSVASDTQRSAILAILASWIAVIGYLWFRFQDISFGFAAVLCLIHDVTISLGILAIASFLAGPLGITVLGLEEFKINLPMVAAILTLIGYSVNDTIVVFDRIREVRGKNPNLTVDIVNTSLNETLARTLLTSSTTLVVTIVLYFFGGDGIHGFTFILTIGILVGTFSSIYISCPLLLWMVSRKRTRAQGARRPREAVAS